MLSTIFEFIGIATVIVFAILAALTAMGWIIMCAGYDEEDGLSMFGFCWGFDGDDEYL